MSSNKERINFDLPAVPHSLRAFIEKAVKDERTMFSFVESPGTALRAAGVPIQTDCLTKGDCDRLKRVLGKLRNLVKSGKLAKDFRFEDVFTIAANVAYEQTSSSTEAYIDKNFDHSTEGHQAEEKSSTQEGIVTEFGGVSRKVDNLIAPLISPGDLSAIAALMQAKISAAFEGK